MELKEFIRETITQIAEGVASADGELRTSDRGEIWSADFNTVARDLAGVKIGKGVIDGDHSVPVLFIEFRVKLGVTGESSKSAGGSIRLLGLALGAKGEAAKKFASDSVHDIEFTIPVRYKARGG